MDETQLYTVRVWRHAGQWRAAVRAVGAVGPEGAQFFTDVAPMVRWLLQAGAEEPGGAGPALAQADGAVCAPNRPRDGPA